MKSKVLIIVFLSLSVHLSCQPYMAEKVRTKGVIITRYSICGDSSYVEMGSRILIKDSLYVFLKHRDNTIIKDNIYLLNDLGGEIKDYGEVFMLSDDHSIVNNLMLCPYDSMFFSKNEGHSFVSARGGFYIRDTVSSDLYAVYNFEGVVILYHGKWPFHSDNTPKEVWEEFGIEYNCGCPEKERHDTIQSFVILLQTVTVSMYNPDLQDKLDLHSTNTNRIPIIFCEM